MGSQTMHSMDNARDDREQATARAILDLVPINVLTEYTAAWDAYAKTCNTGGTPEERRAAYDHASLMDRRLHAATQQAAKEHKRENNRAKAKAVR